MNNERMNKLREIYARAADLEAVLELLGWDEQVYMPSGAADSRALQSATVQSLRHQLLTSPELGELTDQLAKEATAEDPDSDNAVIVAKAVRDFQILRRVPASWVERKAEYASKAHTQWLKARQENDYRIFEPAIQKIIDLNREYAAFFPETEHPLDSLLDLYDEGLTVRAVERVFSALEPVQKKIIAETAKLPPPDKSFLHGDFPAEAQLAYIETVLDAMGYDRNHGRLDLTVHPFTTSFGLNDVRITTKILPEAPFSALFSAVHECGHALYELGIDRTYDRTPLGTGASFSIHESQSRLWENLVARSPEFWEYQLPKAAEYFPALKGVPLEKFLAAINEARPSFLRTEADELTYNMHVILRFRLEKLMMEGKLDAHDLRDAWNAGMKELLGIVPDSDLHGVLQDVHWTMGEFGYFPSYALGNVIASQFWSAALKDRPEIPSAIARGNLSVLREWLREHVHKPGAKYTTAQLLARAGAGSGIDSEPYLNYITKKYSKEN